MRVQFEPTVLLLAVRVPRGRCRARRPLAASCYWPAARLRVLHRCGSAFAHWLSFLPSSLPSSPPLETSVLSDDAPLHKCSPTSIALLPDRVKPPPHEAFTITDGKDLHSQRSGRQFAFRRQYVDVVVPVVHATGTGIYPCDADE